MFRTLSPDHMGYGEKAVDQVRPLRRCPYFSKPGGSGPQQACVLACPMGALSVVTKTPDQTDDTGYDVNLRKKA